MKNIAVIIEDMFEDSEYTEPASAFSKAGYNLTHVGLKKGKRIKGKKEGREVIIELSLKNASVDDFDALLIPGGYSPDKLRSHDEAVKFVKDFTLRYPAAGLSW